MIKIVTDTSANLPEDFVREHDITLVPAYVIFGQEQLREAVDISTAEVIERLDHGATFPKTSQATPYDFEMAYRRILEKHPGATILSIHMTGAASGTVSSASRAADSIPGAVIYVFDTRAFSIGEALMVREAALMAQLGAAADAIMERLRDMRDRVQTFFVLDTIDYLYKGGRMGRATHLIGSLLNIKPMLTVKDGVMEAYARFRTRSQAIKRLTELVNQASEGVRNLQVAVGYVVHTVDAQRLADDLRARLKPAVMLLAEIGPALGVYTGPGVLGISWYAPPE